MNHMEGEIERDCVYTSSNEMTTNTMQYPTPIPCTKVSTTEIWFIFSGAERLSLWSHEVASRYKVWSNQVLDIFHSWRSSFECFNLMVRHSVEMHQGDSTLDKQFRGPQPAPPPTYHHAYLVVYRRIISDKTLTFASACDPCWRRLLTYTNMFWADMPRAYRQQILEGRKQVVGFASATKNYDNMTSMPIIVQVLVMLCIGDRFEELNEQEKTVLCKPFSFITLR